MKHIRLSYLIVVLGLSQLYAQPMEVEGIIVDSESQSPLIGVNIVSGETGTTSDEKWYLFNDRRGSIRHCLLIHRV